MSSSSVLQWILSVPGLGLPAPASMRLELLDLSMPEGVSVNIFAVPSSTGRELFPPLESLDSSCDVDEPRFRDVSTQVLDGMDAENDR